MVAVIHTSQVGRDEQLLLLVPVESVSCFTTTVTMISVYYVENLFKAVVPNPWATVHLWVASNVILGHEL